MSTARKKSALTTLAVLVRDTLTSQAVTLWKVFRHLWVPTDTVQYPEQQPGMASRWRGNRGGRNSSRRTRRSQRLWLRRALSKSSRSFRF